MASWGTVLNEGYLIIRLTPWPIVAGSIWVVLTTLGFTFLGEALRDIFDPRLRKDANLWNRWHRFRGLNVEFQTPSGPLHVLLSINIDVPGERSSASWVKAAQARAR